MHYIWISVKVVAIERGCAKQWKPVMIFPCKIPIIPPTFAYIWSPKCVGITQPCHIHGKPISTGTSCVLRLFANIWPQTNLQPHAGGDGVMQLMFLLAQLVELSNPGPSFGTKWSFCCVSGTDQFFWLELAKVQTDQKPFHGCEMSFFHSLKILF